MKVSVAIAQHLLTVSLSTSLQRIGRWEIQTLDQKRRLTWYSDTYRHKGAARKCAASIAKTNPDERTEVVDLDTGRRERVA